MTCAWLALTPLAIGGCNGRTVDDAVTFGATLKPTRGSSVRGRVIFQRAQGGVRVIADLRGLTPGEHGFHLHERGDCRAPDASTAGGHFNPTGAGHGAPDDAGSHHVGDLGNITADSNGNAHYDRINRVLTMAGPDSILGRGVIVHDRPDDLKSQPSGNAGRRMACGAIRFQT